MKPKLLNFVFIVLTTVVTFSTVLPLSIAQTGHSVTKSVEFSTRDGVTLKGNLYQASTGRPLVILLHMLGKTRQDWAPLVSVLQRANFSVLTLDWRGHGESTNQNGQRINFKTFTDSDWAKLPDDLNLVIFKVKQMPEFKNAKLALVGASIGANTAAIIGARDKSVKAMVLLSPGDNYKSLVPSFYINKNDPATFIVACDDDSYSAQSCRNLARIKDGTKLEIYPSGGHGTDIFNTHNSLIEEISQWLKQELFRQ